MEFFRWRYRKTLVKRSTSERNETWVHGIDCFTVLVYVCQDILFWKLILKVQQ